VSDRPQRPFKSLEPKAVVVSDEFDRETDVDQSLDPDDVDDTPTVSCSRCGQSWDLAYELDELGVGNQAIEQFALDHKRHTGHFPDGVSTWQAECRQCPAGSEHLSEHRTRHWAQTHARHARHAVELQHASQAEPVRIEPPGEN